MSENESGETYATRVFAFGSNRNIPYGYYKGKSLDTKSAIVQERLMLPKVGTARNLLGNEYQELLTDNGLVLSDEGYVQVAQISDDD